MRLCKMGQRDNNCRKVGGFVYFAKAVLPSAPVTLSGENSPKTSVRGSCSGFPSGKRYGLIELARTERRSPAGWVHNRSISQVGRGSRLRERAYVREALQTDNVVLRSTCSSRCRCSAPLREALTTARAQRARKTGLVFAPAATILIAQNRSSDNLLALTKSV